MGDMTTYKIKLVLVPLGCYASRTDKGHRCIRIGEAIIAKSWKEAYNKYNTPGWSDYLRSVCPSPSNKKVNAVTGIQTAVTRTSEKLSILARLLNYFKRT